MASCCAGVSANDVDSKSGTAIVHASCCELRQAPDQPEAPAVAVPGSFAVATVPAAPVVFAPAAVSTVVSFLPDQDSAPRAPPGKNDSSRAPPFLS